MSLKNPLTTIDAYSQLVTRSVDKEKFSEAENYSKKIQSTTQKLTTFINELYQVNQNEVDSAVMDVKEHNLCDVIQSIVEEFKVTAPSHEIITSGCREHVFAAFDKNKVGQVLANYISNAIKYSPGADRVNINIYPSAKEIVVGVKDKGIGIPEKAIEKMFEKYQRAENTGKIEGLGLGLYLCKQIVHAHGGEVWVDSEEGSGSTFFFSLPLKQH